MDRRSFMQGAGALAAGWAMAHAPLRRAAYASACEADPPPGVQLFTVRDQFGRDAAGTLAALAGLGIREVELYGLSSSPEILGMTPGRLHAALGNHGLRAPLSHVDGNVVADTALADAAHALGVEAVVMGIAPEFVEVRDGRWTMVPARSLQQLDRLAERLDELGAAFRALDLRFGYHNHHVEFLPVDGQIPFDYLLERTDPELVRVELDVGWLALAGRDPVEELRRHAGRVIACHLKDFRANGSPTDTDDVTALQRRLVEPGAGSLDFAAVLDTMRATGVAHGFIEIDVSDDPLAAIGNGHRHLQALQRCR